MFWHEGRISKSTIFGTRESAKLHDFVHEEEHQKTRSKTQFFARGKTPKNTILCTKENTHNNMRPKYCFKKNWLLELLGRIQYIIVFLWFKYIILLWY